MASKKKKILCIDGGGIRGIIPGQILTRIENEIGETIGEHFDMIAGTSTGGILTCAFLCPEKLGSSKPKYTAEEVVNLYFQWGGDIFHIPIMHKIRSVGGILDEKYPADGLEEVLKKYFGDLKLSEMFKASLITAYDIYNRKTVFFTSHDIGKDPSKDFLVRDVARATSAAPTYFECAKVQSLSDTSPNIPLIDGGVFANNPSMCAYAEARKHFDKPGNTEEKATAVDMAILSIGTGYGEKNFHYTEAKDWGLAEWIKPIIDIMMSGVSETVHYQLDQIFKSVNSLPDQYVRITGELPRKVDPDMDSAGKHNLDALREFGNDLFEKNRDQILRYFDI